MSAWQTQLAHQLEELHLIQCSLLPGETFSFLLTHEEDLVTWTSLLATFTDDEITSLDHPPCPARFEIRFVDARIRFEIELPRCTTLAMSPATAASQLAATSISVKGDHLSRDAHERWHADIHARMAKIDEACTFPVYELLTLLVTTTLHSSNDDAITPSASDSASEHPTSSSSDTPSPTSWHALLTSHHLISPTKRRSMHQWSSQLGLAGFAKVGYPGVIYAEGPQDAVESFVQYVKGMQWLALRVRFVEPVPSGSDMAPASASDGWVEVTKISQVLEQMRMRGREALVTSLGIGVSSKDGKHG